MIEGAGTAGVEASGGGIVVTDNSRIVRLFKITGGTNPYTAEEYYLDEDDGTRKATGVYDVDATHKRLHEVNGSSTVAVNSIVVGHPNPFGEGFFFDNQTAASPSTITYSWAYLGATKSLTSSSGTWEDVVSVSLASGTWLIHYSLAGVLDANTTADCLVSRFSSGNGICKFCTAQVTGVDVKESASGFSITTLGTTTTVKVQAAREYSGSAPTQSDIIGNSSLWASGMWAIKLS